MPGIGVIIIVIQTLSLVGLATATGGPLGTMRMWPEIVTARWMEKEELNGANRFSLADGKAEPIDPAERSLLEQASGYVTGSDKNLMPGYRH
jgi:hypothetical protein